MLLDDRLIVSISPQRQSLILAGHDQHPNQNMLLSPELVMDSGRRADSQNLSGMLRPDSFDADGNQLSLSN